MKTLRVSPLKVGQGELATVHVYIRACQAIHFVVVAHSRSNQGKGQLWLLFFNEFSVRKG